MRRDSIDDGQTGRGDRPDPRKVRLGSARAAVLEGGQRVLASGVHSVRTALRRPTASDAAMLACTLVIAAAVGASLVTPEFASLAITAGVAAALSTVLLASRRPLVRALGGAVAVPAAVVVTMPVVLALAVVLTTDIGALAAIVVLPLVVATFAAVLLSWRRFGRGGVRRGATGTLLVASGIVAVVAGRIAPESDLRAGASAAVRDALEATAGAIIVDSGTWALLSFAALLLAAAILSSLALASIPLERFVPPDRRSTVTTVVAGSRRAFSTAILTALVAATATFVVPAAVDRVEDPALTAVELQSELPAPVGDVVATLITATGVRLALAFLSAIALALLVLEWSRRILGRGPAVVLARLVAPVVGGALVALVFAWAFADSGLEADIETSLVTALDGSAPPSVIDLVVSVPPFALVAVGLILSLLVLSALLWAVTIVRLFRLIPARAIGAAIAATAVFVLAIALAVVGRPEFAIWTAAGALVLWDVGEYADDVRSELGRDASTMRAELVHIGGTVLTGGTVAGGTVLLYRWQGSVSIADPAYATVTVAAGVFALALVSWALRG